MTPKQVIEALRNCPRSPLYVAAIETIEELLFKLHSLTEFANRNDLKEMFTMDEMIDRIRSLITGTEEVWDCPICPRQNVGPVCANCGYARQRLRDAGANGGRDALALAQYRLEKSQRELEFMTISRDSFKSACEKLSSGDHYEIRLQDGLLDEIVGSGRFHLEQVDTNQWFLELAGCALFITGKRVRLNPREHNTWQDAHRNAPAVERHLTKSEQDAMHRALEKSVVVVTDENGRAVEREGNV